VWWPVQLHIWWFTVNGPPSEASEQWY